MSDWWLSRSRAHARFWTTIDRKLFLPFLRIEDSGIKRLKSHRLQSIRALAPQNISNGDSVVVPASAFQIYKEIASDSSNGITIDEFSDWWRTRQTACLGAADEAMLRRGQALFAETDSDANGRLSLPEFVRPLIALPVPYGAQCNACGTPHIIRCCR